MSNEELDNLIAAFLSGEMDDAAREAFAARLEADSEAMSAFDDALRLELLLRAAHDEPANVASERSAAEKLTEKLKQMKLAKPAQAAAPNRAQRPRVTPRLIKRPSRPANPLTFRAWMALAAAVAIMFGMAFYFIYVGNSNTSVYISFDTKGAAKQKFSVASGHVWVDGRDVREVGENEWVNVAAESSATLATKDGSTITLEAGTSALLRPRGVTLLSGAGRFAVKPAKDLFLLETPVGSVNSSGGEFDARLQTSSFSNEGPQNRRVELGLSVSVSSGTAQVDFDGATTRLAAGESREFSSHQQKPIAGDPANRRPRDDGGPVPPGPGLMGPPRELKVIDAIVRREKELGLTDAQKSTLNDSRKKISEHFAAMGRDSELRELFVKQREAADAGDNAASRRLHDRIRARTDELIEAANLPGNPLNILTLKQAQLMRDELDELPPPPRRGPPGREPRDDDGPPPPRPPPPPPPRGKGGPGIDGPRPGQ